VPENPPDTQAEAVEHREVREREEQRQRLRDAWGVLLFPDWQDRAIAWLADKWTTKGCPYCGNPTWNVGGKLIETRPWAESYVIPMMQATCTNCGHTVSVDATIAGLVENPEEQ
jgi:hypothetical protein